MTTIVNSYSQDHVFICVCVCVRLRYCGYVFVILRRAAAHWPPNIGTQDGFTALIYAAWKGRTDCARLLLDAGADKNATDEVCCWVGLVFGSVRSAVPLTAVLDVYCECI
jgi:hypothetical protein